LVKNPVFLRCVTRTLEHSIIWTQEATRHFMNSKIGNKKKKKKINLFLCTTYRHICEDDVYMHSFFTSATLDTN
jgi:hypothetical protein